MEKVAKEEVTALSHKARIGGASDDTDQVAGGKRTRKNIVLGNSLPYGGNHAFRYACVQK